MPKKRKTSSTTKPSKSDAALALIRRIETDQDMADIYCFVDKQQWNAVGCSSLQAVIERFPDLPSYSTLKRIHNAVVFQKAFLPSIKVGHLRESVLRPIVEGGLSDTNKKRVVEKILSVSKPIHTLTQRDVKNIVDQVKQDSQLSPEDKEAASKFAKKLMNPNILDEIKEYMDENLSFDQDRFFLKKVGSKARVELQKCLGS